MYMDFIFTVFPLILFVYYISEYKKYFNLIFKIKIQRKSRKMKNEFEFTAIVNRNHQKQAAFSISSILFTFVLKKSYVQFEWGQPYCYGAASD